MPNIQIIFCMINIQKKCIFFLYNQHTKNYLYNLHTEKSILNIQKILFFFCMFNIQIIICMLIIQKIFLEKKGSDEKN